MSKELLDRANEMGRRMREFGVNAEWKLPPDQRVYKIPGTDRVLNPNYGFKPNPHEEFRECELCRKRTRLDSGSRSESIIHNGWWLCPACLAEEGQPHLDDCDEDDD